MNKGERTKDNLLMNAMKYSAVHGLSKLTIGEISKMSGMSRTGVISHFKNKEDMQMAILLYIEGKFIERVTKPSFDEDGIKGLIKFLTNWSVWVENLEEGSRASCPFLKVPMEFQDQKDSAIWKLIKRQQTDLLKHIEKIARKCVRQGSFDQDLDCKEFAIEVMSVAYGYYLVKNMYEFKSAKKIHQRRIHSLIERSKVQV